MNRRTIWTLVLTTGCAGSLLLSTSSQMTNEVLGFRSFVCLQTHNQLHSWTVRANTRHSEHRCCLIQQHTVSVWLVWTSKDEQGLHNELIFFSEVAWKRFRFWKWRLSFVFVCNGKESWRNSCIGCCQNESRLLILIESICALPAKPMSQIKGERYFLLHQHFAYESDLLLTFL